ncbi:MAG: methyl-accepting chemotaxis protein [Deltaproteobacteria bacterium]|nr:methyl-accepting chemotaxis protein [Deltaproteobacteria bacterium]
MKERKQRKVAAKLLGWSLPFVALFFALVCCAIYYTESRSQQSAVRTTGQKTVEEISIALENWIGDQVRMAQMIAGDARVVEALKNPRDPVAVSAAQSYLQSVHGRFPYYENLPLAVKMPQGESLEVEVGGTKKTITDGNFITDTVGGKTIGKCGPQFSYIKAIYEGKDYFISEVYPSILRGNPIFVVAAPVKDASGKLLGTAVVAPQMNYFTELFVDKIRIGKTGYLFFMDDRGMLIAHPDKELILKKEATERIRNVCTRLLAGKGEFTEFQEKQEGEERLYIGRKVRISEGNLLHGWHMVFTQTLEEIQASSREFLAILGILGIAFMLVFGIGMSFIVRFIMERPVMRIAENLQEGAEKTRQSSRQVADTSQTLAGGASQQAASLEETSSSMEEMASMTKQNAENASQANRLINEAHEAVMAANLSMSQLTGSMREIALASEETQKIVKTIDEIAFQTNLLALNAAVEAARAGEAGAGFAVVADEVRNLAMRAAEAAKNTANLIENTVKKVQDGGKLVSQTNEAFKVVAEGTAKSRGLIGEIAQASREQSQGIEQVSTAISEIDKVTQQVASHAEDSASVAKEMHSQAVTMSAEVVALIRLVTGKKDGLEGYPSPQISPAKPSDLNGVIPHKQGRDGGVPLRRLPPMIPSTSVSATKDTSFGDF